MAKLVVMYRTPTDTAAFDRHYRDKHTPLAKKIPGLKRLELSQGPIMTPAGPSPFHLIATLHFDDVASLQQALGSPEGQAAAADVGTFATGGADLLIYETTDA